MIATATRRIRWSAVLAATTIVFSVFSSVPGAAPAAAVVPVAEAIPVVPVELVADRVDVGRSVMQVAAAGTATSGAVAPYGSAVGVSRTDTRGRWVSAGSDSLGIAIAEPRIGLAKAATVVRNADRTYQVTYDYVVENLGDVPLAGLDLVVNVGPFGDSDVIGGLSATDGAAGAADRSLRANGDWNGFGNILADGQGLQPGQSGAVRTTFTVTPATRLTRPTTYTTGADVSATYESDTVVDDSTDGTDPDPDDDGDPTNNQDPTLVTFVPPPSGIVLSGSIDRSEGEVGADGAITYAVTESLFFLQHPDLTSVQMYLDVHATFDDATVTDLTVTSGSWSVNEGWTGEADSPMLAEDQQVSVGDNTLLRLSYTVAPGTDLGPYQRSPFVITAVVDDVPTYDEQAFLDLVTFPPFPSIGLAKDATVANNADGTYSVTYDYVVENLGNVPLEDLELVDDVSEVFGAAATGFTVATVMREGYKALNGNDMWEGTDSNILGPGQVLEPGESGVVSVSFTVSLGTDSTMYNTAATVTGNHESMTADDVSTDGTDPDPDENGVPDEGVETVVTFPPRPVVGLAKEVSVTNNGDTYEVTYEYVVENFGNVPLEDLVLVDNASEPFGDSDIVEGLLATNGAADAADRSLVANADWNGIGNILADGQALDPGQSGAVRTTFTVTPATRLTRPTTYTAGAEVSATYESDTVVDDSTDGTDPDPDEDGDPTKNQDPTLVTFVPPPAGIVMIGSIDRSEGEVGADGAITYAVTETGSFLQHPDLTSVQMYLDVHATFDDATVTDLTVTSDLPFTPGDWTVNDGWTGEADSPMLAEDQQLSAGDSSWLSLSYTVAPGTHLGPYRRSPFVITAVVDGVPTYDEQAFLDLVTFPPFPSIGLAKDADVANNADGTYSVTYDYVVENLGNVLLEDLVLEDDVSETFGTTATGFTVGSVTREGYKALSGNDMWEGTDSNILGPGQVLEPGESGVVSVSFTVSLGTDSTMYNTAATVTGNHESMTADDVSTDGTDPDPDENGVPDEGVETVVTFPPRPVVGLAKEVSVTNNGDTYEVTYEYVVENFGNVPLEDLVLVDNASEPFGDSDIVEGLLATNGAADAADRSLVANADWNGIGNILADGQALDPGQSGAVRTTFTVTPVTRPTLPMTYTTGAEVSATYESDTVVDDSTDGTDPDPDEDGDPTKNQDPTLVTFVPPPAGIVMIGSIDRSEGEVGADGAITYAVTETGSFLQHPDLTSVQMYLDVHATFDDATVTDLTVTSDLPFTSGGWTVNDGWTGEADSPMLAEDQQLSAGDSSWLSLSYTVAPGTHLGPYRRSPFVITAVVDGVPTYDEQAFLDLVTFPPFPSIGLAKDATVVNEGVGMYGVTYDYVVENLGNVPLEDLELVDDVSEVFGAAATGFTVATVMREGYKALNRNEGWDGMGSNILGPGQVLEPGESGVVSVSFTASLQAGSYSTAATVTGNHESMTVDDVSTDGTDPDPDEDGVPDEGFETVVTLDAPSAGVALTGGDPAIEAMGVGDDGRPAYRVTLDYDVSAETDVTSVQLYADVLGWFPDGTVTDPTVTSEGWTVNEGWTGGAGSNMLAGGQVLEPGADLRVQVSFTVAPGTDLGPYRGGRLVMRGVIEGGPTYDALDGAVVTFPPQPVIGLAKDASVVMSDDGKYGVTYVYVVENLGNVYLADLVLVDDVSEMFGDSDVVEGLSATNSAAGFADRSLLANVGWAGMGTNILADGQGLEPGESGTVGVALTVTPATVPVAYRTRAEVSASYGSDEVMDQSTSGLVPDADGNGNPGDDLTPTVVTLEAPTGGIQPSQTREAQVEYVDDGTYSVTIDYVLVRTAGDSSVTSLELYAGVLDWFPDAAVTGLAAGSSTGLVFNEDWTGEADSNMLAGGQVFQPGTEQRVTISFRVVPGTDFGPYETTGLQVRGEIGDSAIYDAGGSSVITLPPRPVIGLAQDATVVNNGDGTYGVTYGYVVENLGNVPVADLVLGDDASGLFGTAATGFTVGTVTREGYKALNGNDTWDGTGPNVLVPGQVLEPRESGVVSVSFTVTPASPLDVPLTYNTAGSVTGTYESVTVGDVSTDGTVPDPDGDGDPANNEDPTVVTFVEGAAIGVTKTLSAVGESVGGAYEVTFDYVVVNSGDVNVNNLLLVDDVIGQFAGVGVSGFVATVTDGGDLVTVNEDWDGTTGSNLFSDGQSLLRGASVTVQGSFMVTPATSLEYPGGLATVSGTTPSGATVENTSDVVPVNLTQAVIGLSKQATVVNNGDGTYGVTYDFVVENLGNVAPVDLTLIDNVVEIFGAAATGFTVGTETREGYKALNGNDGWDGTGSNILGADQVLEAGESGVVSVSFTVTPTSPHEVPLTYNTAASVTGTHESGTVADVSTDGADPDPDEDGDPTNNGDVTVVTFNEDGAIGVTKTLDSVVEGVAGAYEVTFDYVVVNSGDVNVNNLTLLDDVISQFPGAEVSGFAATVTEGGDVVTVDEGWDGTAGSNMFSVGQSLLRGTSVTVQGSFMVAPGTGQMYPGGLATVSGSTPSGATVENTSDVVPVDLRRPVIGLAKEATVVNNGDGTYEVTYDFVVENFGNVDLTDVAIYDRARFVRGASGFTVRDGSLMGNDQWSGDRGTSILEANQVLSVGESGTVSVSFTVAPRTDLDPGDSPAEATGGWVGGEVSDGATDGTVPDPDGDGDPTNNGDVTVVEFVESEEIVVTKTLGPVGENVAGAYEVTFNYVVSNTGDVNVNNLWLVDDVIGQFSGAEVSGFAATVTDGTDLVTVNEDWDGTTGSNMFSDGQSLLRGTSVTVRGSFMVTPGTSPEEYPGGSATVSGSTPSGLPVESESDVVPVDLTQEVIGLSKEATVVNNGDGTYGVTYGYVVENLGNVPLGDLTLVDDLFEAFIVDEGFDTVRSQDVTGLMVGTVTLEGYEALDGNDTWDGMDSNILGPGQVLEAGESGVVSVSFTVTPASPHEVPLTYDTTALVSGTYESVTVEDVSTDGTVPDPDGDDDPTNNGDVTVVTFNEAEAISVTKTLGSVGENVAGAYEVTFDYVVSNTGDVNVNNLSLVDDVMGQFPGAEVSGFAATVTDGTDLVTVNEGWDGTAGSNMFSDGQSLLRGTSVTVQGSFMVTPGTEQLYPGGPATVSGTTPSGLSVESDSDVAPVTFPARRLVGLAKEATVVNNGDGTYGVTYGYVVENLGNVPLVDLTLIDNVFETFGTTATGFTAGTVTREGYEALNGDEGWDGTGSNVLAVGQDLAPGEAGVVSVSFTVTPTSPHEVPLTYDTAASVSGTHESVTVEDVSTDGSDPDPDDNGDPTNNGDVTVVTFNEAEAVSVTKTLGSVGENVAGAYEVTFDYVVSNSGDVNVNNLSLVDDVIGQFPGAEVSGFVATVTEGDVVTVNEGWDGTAGSNMFSDGQSLLRGTSVTVRGSFMVTPGTSLEYPGGLATVSGSTPSGAPVEDMSDSVGVSFEGFDLELVVTDSGDAYSGGTLSYVFSTTNLGPGVAYGPLVLVVDVPVGLSIVSASGSNDSCVIEGQVVTCTRVGDLGVGASSDVTVLTTVVAADGVSLAVSGSVMSQGGAAEGSVTNNADTATRVVGALPTTGFVFSWLRLLGALVMVVGSGVVWSANRRREDALL